ncbi:MAG: hypothetical protein ACJ796_22410 [Gemmatimonadaceae bacterium]
MTRTTGRMFAAVAIVVATACSDSTSPSSTSALLTAAFLSTPAGFSATDNSFAAGGDAGEAWRPDRNARDGGGMMGGGMRPEFFGGMPLGRGWDHGPFGLSDFLSSCTLSSSTGRVTCPDATRGSLTISRSFAFTDGAGAAQAAPNSSTNSINEQVTVKGTVTRHDGNVTSDIEHSSTRTVTGLVAGSTQRTVNGASKGTEQSSGKTEDGTSFTASRVVADTTTDLTVPLQDGRPTYPTHGTIVRVMQATVAVDGKSPVSSSRKEVVTYDGSATAKVTITKDGTTKTCTMPLPFGRLECSG